MAKRSIFLTKEFSMIHVNTLKEVELSPLSLRAAWASEGRAWKQDGCYFTVEKLDAPRKPHGRGSSRGSSRSNAGATCALIADVKAPHLL